MYMRGNLSGPNTWLASCIGFTHSADSAEIKCASDVKTKLRMFSCLKFGLRLEEVLFVFNDLFMVLISYCWRPIFYCTVLSVLGIR